VALLNYCIQIKIIVFYLWHLAADQQASNAFPITKEDGTMSALTLKVAVNLVNRPSPRARDQRRAADHRGTRCRRPPDHPATRRRRQPAAPAHRHRQSLGRHCPGQGLALLALDAQQRPAFIAALNSWAGQRGAGAGWVLIRDQDGGVLGAIGISGDTSDIDEQCAITAIEGVGLWADAGVSA
jgi:hypothetical protein